MSWSPLRFPVPLLGLCGFFLASLTILVCSLLVIINKVCLVLGAGHILQDNIASLLFHLAYNDTLISQ